MVRAIYFKGEREKKSPLGAPSFPVMRSTRGVETLTFQFQVRGRVDPPNEHLILQAGLRATATEYRVTLHHAK